MSNIKLEYCLDSIVKCGPNEEIKVQRIVDIYKDSINYTSPINGSIRRHEKSKFYSLSVNYRLCDADFTKWRYVSKNCFFIKDDSTRSITNITPLSQGFNNYDVLIDVTSQNGIYRAKLLSSDLATYKEKQQVLEIWKGDDHIKSFDVNKIDAHGPIATDPCFKCMSWSKIGEQDKLVYCALDTKPQPANFFTGSDSEPSTSTKVANQESEVVSKAYRYKGNWGEATNEAVQTCVAVLDLAANYKINVIKGENQTLINPVLCDNNTKLACLGIDTGDRKYGLIYCNNRPANVMLFRIEFDSNVCVDNLFKIEDNMQAIHNLRVDNSGTKLIFFANSVYGAHRQPSALYLSAITHDNFKANRPLEAQRICKDKEFNLAIQGIPINCFSDDNKYIFISVEERMSNQLLRINVATHEIERITTPTKAIEIFDVNHNHILISGSSIDQRARVFFASLDKIDQWYSTTEERWIDNHIRYEYDEMTNESDGIKLAAAYIRPILPDDPDGILVRQLPTVIMVHGGPHSSFILSYSPAITFYNRLKLRIMLLNYRGSYGCDKRHNDSLLGHIGFHDVKDCIKLIQHFKGKFQLNMDKLAIQGGSHGGFLAAHLSCQKQIRFNCAIIRNPVIDLYSMYVTSDIPDWVLAESLNSDQPEMHLSPDMIEMLFNKSPSGKQLSITTPSLLLLGKADKRVPMTQGLLWAGALRRLDVDCEVRLYDDKHDLFKLDVYSDSHICSAIFLFRYLHK